MTIASIYRKITGKDVQKIQSDIIDSLERELASERAAKETANRRANNRDVDNKILQERVDQLLAERRGLQSDIRTLTNKPDTVVVEKQFVMTQQVYDSFEKSLEAPIVNNNTTAQGAGYLCGIQRALSELRKRFVTN